MVQKKAPSLLSDQKETVSVGLVLRPRRPIIPIPGLPTMGLAEFVADHGVPRWSIDLVTDFATAHGLAVTHRSMRKRIVTVTGGREEVRRVFGGPGNKGWRVPEDLCQLVITVLGTESSLNITNNYPDLATGAASDFLKLGSTDELADFYDFPRGLDGRGETVAVVALDGGYRREDLDEFLRLAGVDPPCISDINVGEGMNRPATLRFVEAFADWALGEGKPKQAALGTAEVTMDIALLAALVPGAHIDVYFGRDTEHGLFDVLSEAILGDRRPSVISISWGFSEADIVRDETRFTDMAMAIDELIASAARLGTTVVAASGDWGASNNSSDGTADLQFPASSPHALACGGTSIDVDGTESAWNATFNGKRGATGGGFSRLFDTPTWQRHHRSDTSLEDHGRGVPDVAAVADPHCTCPFVLAGRVIPTGGTSAAAPVWASLITRINQALRNGVGWINPLLYKYATQQSPPLRDVTRGHNRLKESDDAVFNAESGWDPCTGLGSPIGSKLLTALREDDSLR